MDTSKAPAPVAVAEIDRLILLYENLAQPAAEPKRKPELWAKAQTQAAEEVRAAVKARSRQVSPSPRCRASDKGRNSGARLRRAIQRRAERFYAELDPAVTTANAAEVRDFRDTLTRMNRTIRPFVDQVLQRSMIGADYVWLYTFGQVWRNSPERLLPAVNDHGEPVSLPPELALSLWRKHAPRAVEDLRDIRAVLLRATGQESEAATSSESAGKTAVSEPDAKKEGPGKCGPQRASEVALWICTVRGDKDALGAATDLKNSWDHRRKFYPTPVRKLGRGKPNLYDPIALIEAALGDDNLDEDQATSVRARYIP